MTVFRCFVEKKPAYAVEAKSILNDLHVALRNQNVEAVRVLNRYDLENVDEEDYIAAKYTILSEPQVDFFYEEEAPTPDYDEYILATEYLPGQFDQRADSCAQCIQLSSMKQKPTVKTARLYYIKGKLTDDEKKLIEETLINPVEARIASLEKPETIIMSFETPELPPVIDGFIKLDEEGLKKFLKEHGLAMDLEDLKFMQEYFQKIECRNPTITEVRVIDTYWSDHCRHTTFHTVIDDVEIQPEYVKDTYLNYLDLRSHIYAGRTPKPVCLMDLGTIGAKALKKYGKLTDLDESEEINACSVKIKVDVDGEDQDWLLMFKNETHNHPTEIEPFGGAATCLGGAIRDPLSGRSYVYQAMRVTGAANPLTPIHETMKGKLPQRKLVTTAAAGYSSYGNQIGLATGLVREIYHPGYVAKRMEVGAVIAAAPEENVVRLRPEPGDVVILLGGRTGRDGCGGATGSSKSHNIESLESCGAEVQKGNAPEERKLQRLFRNPEAAKLIKRCNDFGAGGVAVAIGELADGLVIDLNKVPKKYEGLNGTELAISESQERMAVVVRKEDAEKFQELASMENLETTIVAEVTEEPRMIMTLQGEEIVNISREFLNTNGASRHTSVVVGEDQPEEEVQVESLRAGMDKLVEDLNICSQKGLAERFDATIGSGTVCMPFGGKYQMTPSQVMAAKIPVVDGETDTASLMAYGYD
ncbi:phosphoribosylformylglycinamidine synthase, partial [Solobacterium sp.]|uniref:phosphoribosylformylglycinamidine synthase n=1 Tax=Solobacterium sp. TaxID=2060878 RepID=UPI001CAACCA8